MTNKQRIEAAHLEAVRTVDADTGNWGEYGGINRDSQKDAANECTQITADEIGKAMEWIELNGWCFFGGGNMWVDMGEYLNSEKSVLTTQQLTQLYLNQLNIQ